MGHIIRVLRMNNSYLGEGGGPELAEGRIFEQNLLGIRAC
jgi:hypothetical protein